MTDGDKTWLLREVLAFSEEYLAKAKIKNSKREAQWLVSELLGLSRLQMYLQLDRPLIKDELAKIRNGLSRKAKLEPLAYICGVQPFRGLRLEVCPEVLIPRPETEELVDFFWRLAPVGPIKVLDICAGSGCIGLAIAAERKQALVIASDISEKAVETARRNAKSLRLSDRMEFRQSDMFDAAAADEKFDAIVSNPPYIAEDCPLPVSVSKYEPKIALYGGPEGMDFIRILIKNSKKHLVKGGLLLMEIGYDHKEKVEREFAADGGYEGLEFGLDSYGVYRFAASRTRDKD